MVELRGYQHEALAALFKYWREGGGHALVDLPTGTGKSLLVGDLCRRFYLRGRRTLVASHVREIIEQDCKAIRSLWPDMPDGAIGINSAALGERDTDAPVLFATVQSIFRNPQALGPRNLLIIDEAHRVPKADIGVYHRTIAGLRAAYPQIHIAGFSATPYRLDCGRIDEGDDRLFDKIVFSYGLADAIRDKWLSPLIAKGTDAEIDVTGVGKRGGEFIPSELERAANQDSLVEGAVAEMLERGAGRRNGWLAFCCGVAHAYNVRDVLRDHGVACETIVGTTPADERKRIIDDFRAGRILCLTGCDVFTTGFDVAHVDLIALLRPTMSPGLLVQMAGCGTRLSPGKQNCLLLDFANNIARHGPLDSITIRNTGAAPIKECPQCASLVALGTRRCPDCGFEWPVTEGPPRPRIAQHSNQAGTLSPLGGGGPLWLPVHHIELFEHIKPDKPPSLRIDFRTEPPVWCVSDWLAFQHSQRARWHAAGKWRALGGGDPIPLAASEAMQRRGELHVVAEIGIRRDGGYWRVVALRRQRLGAAS
jgi:DNA repair protein RadD